MKLDRKKVDLIRARKCISVADLKERGVPQGTFNSMWRSCNVLPETAGRLARALEVDVTEILAD